MIKLGADPDALRRALLSATVLHAFKCSPLYQRLYAGIDVQCVTALTDLAKLPVLSRSDAFGSDHTVRTLAVGAIQFTSGSTGDPKVILRSQEELGFIHRFFSAVAEGDETPLETPVVVHIPPMQHGSPTPIPGNALVIPTSVSSSGLLEHTISLLRSDIDAPGVASRVTTLSGGQTELVTLTAALADRGIESSSFRIQSVHVTGRLLTERLRAFLQDYWNVPTFNRYSMAEAFGGATECLTCGYFHFDPQVVAEASDEAAPLLLTCLYPFVQMQPLIRYDTGDIARLVSSDCLSPAIDHLGRQAHALVAPEGQVLISGAELDKVLDREPSVRRSEHYLDVKGLRDYSIGGRPHCRGRAIQTGARVDLHLEVEVAETAVAADVEQRVREAVLVAAPALADRSTTFEVSAVEPNTLPPLYKKTSLWRWTQA